MEQTRSKRGQVVGFSALALAGMLGLVAMHSGDDSHALQNSFVRTAKQIPRDECGICQGAAAAPAPMAPFLLSPGEDPGPGLRSGSDPGGAPPIGFIDDGGHHLADPGPGLMESSTSYSRSVAPFALPLDGGSRSSTISGDGGGGGGFLWVDDDGDSDGSALRTGGGDPGDDPGGDDPGCVGDCGPDDHGTPPIPEPGAALLFALGFATVLRSRRASRR